MIHKNHDIGNPAWMMLQIAYGCVVSRQSMKVGCRSQEDAARWLSNKGFMSGLVIPSWSKSSLPQDKKGVKSQGKKE